MIKTKRSFLFTVLSKTCFFLLVFQLILFGLYVMGNFFYAPDSFQFILLQTLIPIAIFTVCMTFFSLIGMIVFSIIEKNTHYLFFLPTGIIIEAVSLFYLIYSNAVKFFAVF